MLIDRLLSRMTRATRLRLAGAYALIACFVCIAFAGPNAFAQDSAEELAKKAQDPLADITALMTDNTIGFNQGLADDTGYNFQLQPVKSFDTPYGFRLIARGIVPIVGAPTGSDFVFLGDLGGPAASSALGNDWSPEWEAATSG